MAIVTARVHRLITTWSKAPKRANLRYVNNRNYIAYGDARMFLDSRNNYHLELDVNCMGGVTRDNVTAYLKTYDRAVERLKKEL